MRKLAILPLLCSCAALDAPVAVSQADGAPAQEVPLGDVIADNAEPVADFVGALVGGVNPALGLMAAGALGSLLASARTACRSAGG